MNGMVQRRLGAILLERKNKNKKGNQKKKSNKLTKKKIEIR